MTDKYEKINLFVSERLLVKDYIVLKRMACDTQKFDLFNIAVPGEVLLTTAKLDEENSKAFSKTNREGFTYFHDLVENNQRRLFLYTTLFCEKTQKAIVTFNVSGSGKVWLNGKCIYGYVNEYCWSSRVLEVDFVCGTNSVIIEMDTNDKENVFNMIVSDFEYEKSEEILSLANTDFQIYTTGCVVWLLENDFLPSEHNCRFSVIQSCDKFEDDFEIEIYNWKFCCIDRLDGSFCSEINVNLDKYRLPDEHYGMKNIMIKCILKDKANGETFSSERIVYISNLTDALKSVTLKAIAVSSKQPKTISDNIIGKINILKNAYKYNEYARVYWGLRQMNDMIDKAENNEIAKDFYNLPGNHDFYIYSKLDNSLVNIKAYVPNAYDGGSSMPAIFALATSKEGYFTQRMDFSRLDEECLCFDITGRGYTSGSYIGEASIMELIEWVLDKYNVDKSRIYLLGYSNGAFATWAIAQNYPNMFAAIFPLAGLSSIEQNSNLQNCNVFQIISPDDYLYRKQKALIETWKSSDKHTLFFTNNMLHVSMYPQLTNYKIINKLLECRKIELNDKTATDNNKTNPMVLDYFKDKGLLNVYCNSMRIIVDENSGEIIKKTAKNLSKPTSSGMEPEIDVKYPVYESSDLPSDIYTHNLIYLYNVSSEKCSIDSLIHENMSVKCSSEGFVYMHEVFMGDYVYMQIIPQHLNKEKSVLIIATNNEALLSKHILLRKVVIPSYYSGFHPYWNQNGLLYYNNKYVVVK